MNLFRFLKRETPEVTKSSGLGTFFGVYMPGILAVFGVIIYLRLGWIVGAVGFPVALAIISLAFLITALTALSIASIATNMRVGSGGTYYIISRSFGIELGSAIGNALFVAQTLSIAFCAAGFAESLHSVLPIFPIQTIGIVTLVVLAALVYVSSQAALKAQFVIFLLVGISLVTLFVSHYVPTEASIDVVKIQTFSFWPVFAIFFPAATGIETAIGMSGSLRNPKRALPFGTLAIVFSAYIVYVFIAYYLSNEVPRHVLLSEPLIVLKIARVRAFILVGIWAATLSSSIGGLMSAPRMLQAIAQDGVLPKFLAKESGPNREPRIASIVTFIFAIVAVYFGSIDLIAPYLTMFTLIAYAMLNVGAGIESFFNNPSWRPTLRISYMVPLIGAALCLVSMLLIDSGQALIAISVIFAMYFYIKRKNHGRRWDDIRAAILQYFCRSSLYRLINAPPSPKSWRPNFLVFTRTPAKSNALFKIASAITRDIGFLSIASFVPGKDDENARPVSDWERLTSELLSKHKTPAIVNMSTLLNPLTQIQELIRCYGMGPIRPNTIVFGLPQNPEALSDLYSNLAVAEKAQKNILLIGESQIPSKYKVIDIWWDSRKKKSSEFMMLIALLLTRTPEWKKAVINLKSTVPNEESRKSCEEHFREYFLKSRLPIQTEVLVVSRESPHTNHFFSKDADLVMLHLPNDTETLKSELKLAKQFPQIMYCKSSGVVDFAPIFN